MYLSLLTKSRYLLVFCIIALLAACSNAAEQTGSKTVTLVGPENVQLQSGDRSITVSWEALEGAESYNIYWSEDSEQLNPAQARRIDHAQSPYVHDSLENDKTYYYFITAVFAGGQESEQGRTYQSTPRQGGNSLPVFTSGAGNSIVEGTITAYGANADDADDDALTYDISGGDDQALFYIDGDTGVLSFLREPDFEQPADRDADNVYQVEISVFDGTDTRTLPVTITVTNAIPAIPQNFSVSNLPGNRRIRISWDPVEEADSYAVYWNNSGQVSDTDARLLVAHPTTEIEHPQLDLSQTYHYRVRAVSGDLTGDLTEELATTPVMSRWQWLNPLPQANSLGDVAWGGGRWLAVGDYGTIISSVNGQDWTVESSGITEELNGVAYGANRWIAVGWQGTILTSVDGVRWESVNSGTTSLLNDVHYANGLWVAVGLSDTVLTSADGLEWTNGNSGHNVHIEDVDYGAGVWVAVGRSGEILTSDAAGNWQATTSETTERLLGVAFANNQWVVVGWNGTIRVSTDATASQWVTPATNPAGNILYDVSHDGSQWLAVGFSGEHYTSPDADVWTQQTKIGDKHLESIFSNGTQSVTVGLNGSLALFENTVWTLKRQGAIPFINDVTYHNGQWVAVASSGIVLSSANGDVWVEHPAATGNRSMYSVDHDESRWIAAGSSGSLYASTNGSRWDPLDSRVSDTLNAIAYDGNQWVSVGINGAMISSLDGVIWDPLLERVTTQPLKDVAGNGNLWVAVGGQGTILTSTNGRDWTDRSQTEADLEAVAFGNNQWVATGLVGAVLTSPDGINWTEQTSQLVTHIVDVKYADSQWMAVGLSGTIASSQDARRWYKQHTNTNNSIYGIDYDGSRWIAAGYFGTIFGLTP